jgi:hypothetical protein
MLGIALIKNIAKKNDNAMNINSPIRYAIKSNLYSIEFFVLILINSFAKFKCLTNLFFII